MIYVIYIGDVIYDIHRKRRKKQGVSLREIYMTRRLMNDVAPWWYNINTL